jgi:STE24 endopeptidase
MKTSDVPTMNRFSSNYVRNILLTLLLLVVGTAAWAEDALKSQSLSMTSSTSALSLAELHLPAVTATMLQYSRIRYGLYFFAIAYSLAVLLLIMQTGLSALLRDYSIRANRNKAVQIILYAVLLTLSIALLSLPLSFFSGFYLEHMFKLSDQSITSFFLDKLKMIGVSVVLNCIALLTFFGVVRRFRVHWPLVLWLISIPIFALGIFAEPVVIDPLFNKFTPMEQSSLKTKITDLAAKAGIPNAVILVADKSKQTNKMNAYVTGLGDTSRIVLWDSTISKLPEDQVLAVVGHEIGHYKLNHIYWGFALIVVATLIFVAIAYFCANAFVSALSKHWQVGSINDYAITPVLLALTLTIGFLSMPLVNFFSRYQEHAADKFGLELTGDRLAMANLFIAFAEKNLSEPDPPPVIKFFLFTHPTLKERIEFAAGRKVE